MNWCNEMSPGRIDQGSYFWISVFSIAYFNNVVINSFREKFDSDAILSNLFNISSLILIVIILEPSSPLRLITSGLLFDIINHLPFVINYRLTAKIKI